MANQANNKSHERKAWNTSGIDCILAYLVGKPMNNNKKLSCYLVE